MLSWAGTEVEEIRRVLEVVDQAAVAAMLAATGQASRLFFSAQGRSGLIAAAIAMRWMHLGVRTHIAGAPLTPAIGKADLLVCLSASGRTEPTVANAHTASAVGARVAVVTAITDSPLAAAADLLVLIPARTGIDSAQHAGSLFEQTCLILGDALCGAFQEMASIPGHDLDRRHANLR